MDRTLILVKPDAFARGLTGEIIARFERKGLRIAALDSVLAPNGAERSFLRRPPRRASAAIRWREPAATSART